MSPSPGRHHLRGNRAALACAVPVGCLTTRSVGHIALIDYTSRVYTQCIVVFMDTRTTLLGLLDAGSGYGYDLKNSWDRWFGDTKPLAYGQIYSTLARLLRDGLIEARGSSAGAGPDRKQYAITPAGHDVVTKWIFTPEVPADSIKAELFAKTVIALLLHDDAERLLDLQRAEHLARMRELTRAKKQADLAGVLLADHSLFHIEADLRWIDLTASRLGELREQVVA
ncbi:hypothetical protein HMPREF1531_01300 [Propionibacterium sp. oral taxon 192 str. F0372]|nr:hypothetical protein HMPREF1531_01300 [Propionibacterium sp. oral taxon 192 str. F0372]